jgi:putative transposase
MPNHFHFVLWPLEDGDLGRWMHWLMTSHVRRHHAMHGTQGHVWQGPYKAFPIQEDKHFLTVMRYVERNPLRAGLVERAEEWPWSSLASRDVPGPPGLNVAGPVDLPAEWLDYVNQPQTPSEVESVRASVHRGAPYGGQTWVEETAVRLGLESTLRRRGRPAREQPN